MWRKLLLLWRWCKRLMATRVLQRNKRVEVTVTFNASGTALAIIGVPLGPSWEVIQITVSTTITTTLSKCTTFVGTNNSGVKISSTLLGNFDTDSTPNTTVRSGESLCAEWTQGISGQTARLTVIYNEVDY